LTYRAQESIQSFNDDQLADTEEVTRFNDEQPFINFENQYGLNSLRAQISAAEANWLATTAGDSTAGPDPDDSYMDESEIRTLVNSSGDIKVGSNIYHFNSDGSYYEIYDDGGGGGGGSGGCNPPECMYLMDQNRKNGKPLPSNVRYVDNGSTMSNFVFNDCQTYAKNKGFRPDRGGNNVIGDLSGK